MKLYVYNYTQSEKMVYLSCVRNVKEGNKYNSLPFTLSLRKSDYAVEDVRNWFRTFPVILDVEFRKGSKPVIKKYEKV